MKETITIKCPLCRGCGEIANKTKLAQERRKEVANILLEKGYGIREIQRITGFKSPNSVFRLKKCK